MNSSQDSSAPSWVLPIEAKNLIKFLTDTEPVVLEEFEEEEVNESNNTSTSSDAKFDYSASYDFCSEGGLSDCRSSVSSTSAMPRRPTRARGDSDDYSCSNASNSMMQQSYMVDQSTSEPMPAVSQSSARAPVDDFTQKLLNKVKLFNHGIEDNADYFFPSPDNDLHPQNVADLGQSLKETDKYDQLEAIQSGTARLRGNRFEVTDYRNEIVRLRAMLSDEKEKYRNLQVSSGVYEELTRTPEFELSLLDFVRLRAADLVMPLQEEVHQLRMLSEQQQARLDEGSNTISSQSAGMEVQKRMADSSIEAYKMEARAASERADRLSEKLAAAEKTREESELLASRCNVAEGERDSMREELVLLRDRWEQQGRVLMSLNETERELRADLDHLRKNKDMLELDKSYLSRELSAMSAKYDEASRLVDHQKLHTSTAEVKVQELTDRLLSVQLTQRTEFDKTLEIEVRKLRETSQREMEDLRQTSKDIIDRENKVLRETKAHLESQLHISRQEINSLTAKLETLREAQFSIQTAKESDIALLKADCKLNSYNLTATSANYEEKCIQLREVSAQLDQSREENNTLRVAVQQFEAKMCQDTIEITAERDALRQKLAVYDALENNIDKAVVMVAASEKSVDTAKGMLHPALQDFAAYPSDPSRRLSQCLAAVTRSIQTQKERDQLKAELDVLIAKHAETTRQLDVANGALSRVPHPHGYLVNKLRELDDKISKQAIEIAKNEKEISQLSLTLDETQQQKNNVQHRLEQLLRQRSEVEGLRILLERMQECEENEVSVSSDESESEAEEDIDAGNHSRSHMSNKSAKKSRDYAPTGSVERLNKTWSSPSHSVANKSSLLSPSTSRHQHRHASPRTPTNKDTSHTHNIPKGMSTELFMQMTSPNPSRGPNGQNSSTFGTGQSQLSGFAVTPNSESPAWHKRESLH